MGFKSIVETLHLNDNNTLEQIHFQNNKISSATFEMMKKLNDIFVAKKVVFYLDKIEGGYKMDCVKFNKS